MSAESAPRRASSDLLIAAVIEQLACPVCFAGLRLEGADLRCAGCGRVYPIIDGIPVLIAESVPDRSK